MKVQVTEELQASGEVVWQLVRGFGEIMKWSGGAVESVSVEGDGIGAVRTIGIAGGAQLQEKLEAHDDAKRTFSYSFVANALLPVDDYYATMTIIETGANQCRVEWGSTFTPNGVSEEQAGGMVEGIYKSGIAGIKSALTG
ncbi:MAG: SRPBCC family protein [Myxococcota bacterium]|jgi:hypothetical protein